MIQKISFEFNVLIQEHQKIKKALNKVSPITQNFQPYLKMIKYVKNLHTTFTDNFLEFLNHQQLRKILEHWNYVGDDLVLKMEEIKKFCKGKTDTKEDEQKKQICQICNEKIRQNNIKYTRNILQHNPKKEFDSLVNQFRKLSDENLFTQDENFQFERKLYQNLSQKEKILNMYSRQIEQFTTLVDSSITQLNALKEIKGQQIQKNNESTRYVNMGKISEDVTKFLQISFQNKIPPWIHKMFSKMMEIHVNAIKSKQKEHGSQTIRYEAAQMKELVKENKSIKKSICDLKGEFREHLIYAQKLKFLIQSKNLNDLNQINTPKCKSFSETIFTQTERNELKKLASEEFSIKLNSDIQKKMDEQSQNGYLQSKELNRDHDNKRKSKTKVSILNNKIRHKKNSEKLQIQDISKNLEKRSSMERKKSYKNNYEESIKEIDAEYEAENNQQKKKKVEQSSSLTNEKQKKEKEKGKKSQLNEKTSRSSSYIKNHNSSVSQMKAKKKMQKKSHELTSIHEKLAKQKMIVKEVSSILQKNKENKAFLPKLGERKRAINIDKDPLKNQILVTPRLTEREQEKSRYLTEVSKEVNENEKSKELQRDRSKDNLGKSTVKKIQKVEINEEKVYSILKENSLIPESLTFLEFKALIRQDSLKNSLHLNHHYNSIFSLGSDRSQKENQEKINDFYDEDFNLFITPKIASQYEDSLSKNYHKRYLANLNAEKIQICSKLYEEVNFLKKQEKEKYNKICTLLRYPFQTLFNDFSILNFVAEMNYSTFQVYFRKIVWLHRKCMPKKGICFHILDFFRKNID